MDASSRPMEPPRVPVGMLGMIAVMVLVELGLGRSHLFDSDLSESWRIKASAARREAIGSDVLCFGDSLVEFALMPQVFEERLGGRAYNLALHAGASSTSYFLLKHALDAGARPKAIVVDFMPHQIALNPGHEVIRRRAWPELATLGDAVDLWRTLRDGDLFGSIVLGKVFASVEARPEIRAAIAGGFRGEGRPVDDVLHIAATYRNLKANRGAYVMPASTRTAADPVPVNCDYTSLVYDPTRLVYMDRFLRLASEHGIPVYWVVMPISPEYQALADASGTDAQYGEMVRRFERRFPNVVVLDGRRTPGYGPGRFMDMMHLDGKGAAALTNEVADLMLSPRAAGAPRHVTLAAYRDRPPARHVEDVHESKVAFAQAWIDVKTKAR
jgi:hypothetical protein